MPVSRAQAEGLVMSAIDLPRREARRWAHTHLEPEELVAEGNLGLARAAARFDPRRGTPFRGFALPYVRFAIVDAVKARARRNRLPDGTYVDVIGFPELKRDSDDRPLLEPADPRPGPDAIVISLERLRALRSLPAHERAALIRTIVDGQPASTVASELGLSVSTVFRLVHTGSRRLRRRAA